MINASRARKRQPIPDRVEAALRDGDADVLADFLRLGTAPHWFLQALADLLAPTKPRQKLRLEFAFRHKGRPKAEGKSKDELGFMVIQALSKQQTNNAGSPRRKVKLEAALHEVMTSTGKTRSTVLRAYKECLSNQLAKAGDE